MSYLPSRRRRFSRLLSDHEEHCFGEYSCWYSSQTHNTQSKGRLYVLSGSLTYEPDDQSQLLHRISYQQISTTKPANNTIHISYTQSTYQQTRKPWVFENSSGEIAVQLTASDTQQVLQLLNPLLMLAQALHSDAISHVTYKHDIQQLVKRHEAELKFNTSAIGDFTEKPILQLDTTTTSHSTTTCRITILTPLLATPALLYITNKKLYLQYIGVWSSDRPVAFKLSEIVQVHDRRHDMNDNSLELFFRTTQKPTANNHNVLPSYSIYIQFSTPDERNSVKLSLLSYLPTTPSSTLHYWITEWLNGRIDNFTYLMQLNIFSGRSMHDLSQYPIYPWVVADYSSDALQLNEATTYRPLGKPIGTLNDERLDRFKKRYTEIKELNDSTQPPFLYGSFYSTPGYVLYYLVRSQPELMLSLQHGRFDKPDRLFASLTQTWQSVCTAPTDLKELIPQFYDVDGVTSSYQTVAAPTSTPTPSTNSRPGQFLLNTSGLDLGILQNGTTVNDVALPPWSSDADDCIRQLRAALESEYVTEHLAEWIDLVFGYKMTGDEAVKADNVFYHISYPHYHLSSRLTSEQRESVTRQLHEFGQVPVQLFATKHPKPSSPKQLSQSELTKLTNVQHPKSPKPAKRSQSHTNQPPATASTNSTASSPVRKHSGAVPPTAQPVHRGSPDKLPAVTPPVAAPVQVPAAVSEDQKTADGKTIQPSTTNGLSGNSSVASVTSSFMNRFWPRR